MASAGPIPLSQWRSIYSNSKGVLQNPFSVNSWNGLNHSLIGHGTIDNYILTHSWASALAHTAGTVVSYFCGEAAIACATVINGAQDAYQGWLRGGTYSDQFDAGFMGAWSGFMQAAGNQAIGGIFTTPISNILSHAAFVCAMASAEGGQCGAGALSGAITAAADIGLQSGGRLDTGDYFVNMGISLAAGCLGSRAGGGTCAAGIASSAFIYMGLLGIVWVNQHDIYTAGSMEVSTLRRRYSSSCKPYARRWRTRILLLSPSTKPSETLFSGWQYAAIPSQ